MPSGDERAFVEWFSYLAEIAQRCRHDITAALERGGVLATGPAKVIDNAIVGFMLTKDAHHPAHASPPPTP